MRPAHALFQRFGVELEYMIVDARGLSVRPWADRLIRREAGDVDGDVVRGPVAWSNELALHLIEFKTARPVRSLDDVGPRFQEEVAHVNELLAEEGACLLSTAMHPWMNPTREGRLWPHECGEIYRAFDRIFNCRGHGWTNLQSAHLNLPFANDAEFERLHAAIRVLLPLLPALAASSPFLEGRRGRSLDMRLQVYCRNCARVPSVTGMMVPEVAVSEADYHRRILQPIYGDLAPHDAEGVLRHEWVNARGAIARFERRTIEIRVLDLQECPAADLAILQSIVAVLRDLTAPDRSDPARLNRIPTADLADLMRRVIRSGGRAGIRTPGLLRAFGADSRTRWTVHELWRHLLERSCPTAAPWRSWVERILEEGTLSERILRATGARPGRARLRAVYRRLADCLARGLPFSEPSPTRS